MILWRRENRSSTCRYSSLFFAPRWKPWIFLYSSVFANSNVCCRDCQCNAHFYFYFSLSLFFLTLVFHLSPVCFSLASKQQFWMMSPDRRTHIFSCTLLLLLLPEVFFFFFFSFRFSSFLLSSFPPSPLADCNFFPFFTSHFFLLVALRAFSSFFSFDTSSCLSLFPVALLFLLLLLQLHSDMCSVFFFSLLLFYFPLLCLFI